MALRLRRGTDAERLIITPADGEIIYTTDTKRIFVGDGVTVGGNPVSISSINDVGDVDITTTPPTFGQTLKWNGSAFVPGNDEQIAGTGVIEGNNYRINISADDSTIMVNTATNTLTGDLVGNVTGDVTGDVTGNLTGDVTGDLNGNVLLPDGTILLNRSNGNLYTNIGDLLIDSSLAAFFGDVDGNIRGSLFNQSLTTILVDHVNETFNGTLVGDVRGSVFGDDSTVIIDSVNNTINTDFIVTSNTLQIRAADNSPILRITSFNDRSILDFEADSNSDLNIPGVVYGTINFSRNDINGKVITGSISGGDALYFGNDLSGSLLESAYFTWTGVNFGIGTVTPQAALDVRGNAVVEGGVEAAAFKGSLMADDSTTIIDAISGTITASGFIQFGSYTDAEIALVSPLNGMVYYNTTANRFRGYQNGAWINLDDGTAA